MITDNSMAKLISATDNKNIKSAVEEAVKLLRAGEIVALPTETVYGLAANALNPDAVAKIFKAKGRPPTNPIIVHVDSIEMAKKCVKKWGALADKLAQNFWPGPLTLVLEKSEIIPDIVTAGGKTVGVRFPSHPIIVAVIQECGFPLAAPSANLSSRISPTTAQHVLKSLGDKIPLIIDGGECNIGIESTVLDITTHPPRILRPGLIHQESLSAVIGGRVIKSDSIESSAQNLKSPGLLRKHYSPNAKLILEKWNNEQELGKIIERYGCERELTHILTISNPLPNNTYGKVIIMPKQAKSYAKALYSELHKCDEEGAKWIIAQYPPETSEWHAVIDRLRRASTD